MAFIARRCSRNRKNKYNYRLNNRIRNKKTPYLQTIRRSKTHIAIEAAKKHGSNFGDSVLLLFPSKEGKEVLLLVGLIEGCNTCYNP
ncbi:MAG: hypothetical protein Q4G09_07410 [Clostridia bacterium]|nr:hypothetical protein [Clostridia bacterium]